MLEVVAAVDNTARRRWRHRAPEVVAGAGGGSWWRRRRRITRAIKRHGYVAGSDADHMLGLAHD
jgi:hypothetical protein